MSEKIAVKIPAKAYRRTGLAALAVLALTAAHHIYGAIVYETPWRLHVAVVAPIAALAIGRCLYVGGSRQGTRSGTMWTRTALALVLIVPVGLIGLVEGGYNHVVKNLAYWLFGTQAARAMFPAPAYEMPNDFLFEVSGIAQFPLALLVIHFLLPIVRGSLAAR